MDYAFTKKWTGSFADAEAKVRAELQKEGFGVLTEINVQETLKKKIDADFRPYKILGACAPPFALKAMTAEPHIGLMLPCNVVVQELDGAIIVSAIDPVASMMAVKNNELGTVAQDVREKLQRVIAAV